MDRTESGRTEALRRIPSVDQLLRHEVLSALPRPLVVREARAYLENVREQVERGEWDASRLDAHFANGGGVSALLERCRRAQRPRHRRVYNATGIVLHTGIGRACLAPAAASALAQAAGFSVVEVDPETGERDERELGIAAMLRQITAAGGALVVNNNAAATNLMLTALTAGREVVVSRGEQVEIGGGFRMPDVMAQAGCRMVEVGATNRTHLRDYARAITPECAALLKIHTSNFRIEGFHTMPSLEELCRLAAQHGVLALEDLGSGLLLDAAVPGLENEPRVMDSLRAGVHVVCFSGDKLLGGPQCGILLGQAERIAEIRAHPLYRAFRCDKLTLAALEATLAVYRDGDPLQEIPALRMIAADRGTLGGLAKILCEKLAPLDPDVVASESFVGSGANPARPLPSFAVALPGGDAVCGRLRRAEPVPVFSRVAEDKVLLDLRTLMLEDLDVLASSVREALQG